MSFAVIQRQFFQITRLSLEPRQTNRLDDGMVRADLLFMNLSEKVYQDPRILDRLMHLLPGWLAREDTETLKALAGYVHYMRGDFAAAANYLLAAVSANPDNLDNWVDLAFALLHKGDDDLGLFILFNFEPAMQAYRRRGSSRCNLALLRDIADELAAERLDYRYVYPQYVQRPAPST